MPSVPFRDRFNTVINVFGDCIGVSLIHHVSKDELERMDEQERNLSRYKTTLSEEKAENRCTMQFSSGGAGALAAE